MSSKRTSSRKSTRSSRQSVPDSALRRTLTRDELRLLVPSECKQVGERVFETLDRAGGGQVDVGQLRSALRPFADPPTQTNRAARLSLLFTLLDVDADRRVSNGELFHVLNLLAPVGLTPEQLQQVVDLTMFYAAADSLQMTFEDFVKFNSAFMENVEDGGADKSAAQNC